MARVRLGSTAEVPAGEGRVIEAGGTRIALFNVDGRTVPSPTSVPTAAAGRGDLETKVPLAWLALR